MGFAVVQKSLDPPAAGQLIKAFEAVESLTASDARLLAKDAYGILVQKLSFNDAAAVQGVLAAEGVETEVVDQDHLPKPPAPKALKRAACEAESLLLYDALGRAAPVPWERVILIAAGGVGLIEVKREAHEYVVYRGVGRGAMPVKLVEFSDKAEEKIRLVLELFVEAVPARYRAMSHRFHYGYLGARMQPRASRNFVQLVRDLVARSPNATVGRGAAALAADPPRTFSYPTLRAFEEEIVWQLWNSDYLRRRGEGEAT